jgi:LuxR family maltose regulon positive regulatory protein
VAFATRHDPVLRLHRQRLAGDLVEIRVADLRFSLEEARALLEASGVHLTDDSLAELHARTEGWAAGLRLASIALRGQARPEQFVTAFSGSDRTVADYLLAEVLERQAAEVRQLLLRTSILDRVNGALADALVGTVGSDRLLLQLEQTGAFLVPVDAQRTWFRYHQLFRDLLRLELRRTDPDAILDLHRTAARWHAEHGFVLDAVRHAQATEDWGLAARLLSDHGFSLSLEGHGATMRSLMRAFPAEWLADPELAAFLAYLELTQHALETAEGYVAVAQGHASQVSPDRQRRLSVSLGIARLGLARRRGDLESALREVTPLLDPIEAGSMSELVLGRDARAVALMNLGIVELWAFELEEAERHLGQGLDLARAIDRAYVQVGCLQLERPQLDDAEVHQGDGPGIPTEDHLAHRPRLDRVEERCHLAEGGLEVTAAARERQPGDPQRHAEATLPIGRDLRRVPLGHPDVALGCLERVLGQLQVGEEGGELGIGQPLGREGPHQGAHGRPMPLQ